MGKELTSEEKNIREQQKINIEKLLWIAVERHASDIHIVLERPIQLRINGKCIFLEDQVFSAEEMKYLIHFLLNDKQKKCLQETGEVTFAFSTSQKIRCRASIFLQRGYYAAVFHLLGIGIPKAETLKIPQSVLELYKENQGLVIVSGASGSGRTTTLAVLLDRINQEIGGHILTLESPVEYLHVRKKAMVHQRGIGLDVVNYTSALKAAIREDADVLLVGEAEDAETIEKMITAAEMGHFVFGVMDVVGAVETIERMTEVFSPEQRKTMQKRLAYALKAVVSQRLIPIGDEQRAVFDVILADKTVRNLIEEGKTASIKEVMQNEKGMQRMEETIFEWYIQGKLDREQALRYVRDASLVEKMLI